jgi:hypothetical protein
MTLDEHSPEEFEVDIPTEEEKKAEFERLYPDKSKATYLQYPCHYSGTKFFLENRDRGSKYDSVKRDISASILKSIIIIMVAVKTTKISGD